MARPAHPTYTNPTIAEALCEIHFRLPADRPWSPTIPGELFTLIQAEFPVMEALSDLGVELGFERGQLKQTVQVPRPRTRFQSASKDVMLQLTETVLTVNVLPPYRGWARMSEEVLKRWAQLSQLVHPSRVTRIGLRYVNLIPRASVTERAGEWLRPNDYISPAALRSGPGFLSRVQATQGDQNRIIVTVGEQTGGPSTAPPAIVFDIDRIVEREMGPTAEEVGPEMERLHEDVWEVFSSALSERLEAFLKAGRA